MSFSDLPNSEVQILRNICYCLFSAPQDQFKAEKKRVLLGKGVLFDQ